MSWLRGAFLGLLTVAIVAFGLGFLAFAHAVRTAHPPDQPPDVEGIVALTGGSLERLSTGVQLLTDAHGRRLLISGVNPSVTDHELYTLLGINDDLARCCVDLGRAAEDTLGNASEAAAWARRNGFHSLILVTDDYHMPRSLAELRIAMPEARIIPFPVETRYTRREVWQSAPSSVARLAGEYVKYLTIRVREGLIALNPPHRRAPA